MAPNGNGGVFEAVSLNHEIQKVIKNVEYIQIQGVDNVLGKILDPIFIGISVKKEISAAMKTCIKKDV